MVRPLLLGIEGGGTRTVALVADTRGQILKRAEFGPLNLKLSSDQEILRRLRDIKRCLARSLRLWRCVSLVAARLLIDPALARWRAVSGRVCPLISVAIWIPVLRRHLAPTATASSLSAEPARVCMEGREDRAPAREDGATFWAIT